MHTERRHQPPLTLHHSDDSQWRRNQSVFTLSDVEEMNARVSTYIVNLKTVHAVHSKRLIYTQKHQHLLLSFFNICFFTFAMLSLTKPLLRHCLPTPQIICLRCFAARCFPTVFAPRRATVPLSQPWTLWPSHTTQPISTALFSSKTTTTRGAKAGLAHLCWFLVLCGGGGKNGVVIRPVSRHNTKHKTKCLSNREG